MIMKCWWEELKAGMTLPMKIQKEAGVGVWQENLSLSHVGTAGDSTAHNWTWAQGWLDSPKPGWHRET